MIIELVNMAHRSVWGQLQTCGALGPLYRDPAVQSGELYLYKGRPGVRMSNQSIQEKNQKKHVSEWNKATTAVPEFGPLAFTVANPGFQLLGANIPKDELGFFQLFFSED